MGFGSIVGGMLDGVFAITDRIDKKKQRQENMEREDTAIQRKVADMREAGLSPLTDFTGAESNAGQPIDQEPMNMGETIGAIERRGDEHILAKQQEEANDKALEISSYEASMKKLDALDYADKKLVEAQTRVQELENAKKKGEQVEADLKEAEERVKKIKAETYAIYNSEAREDKTAEAETKWREKQAVKLEKDWKNAEVQTKIELMDKLIDMLPQVKASATLGNKLASAGMEVIGRSGSIDELIKQLNKTYAELTGDTENKITKDDAVNASELKEDTNAVKPSKPAPTWQKQKGSNRGRLVY